MRRRLDGATAVVTGATSGIGLATSRLLADHGCRVVLVGRDQVALRRAARQTGGVECLVDLTSPDAADTVVRAAGGQVDLLVNNAGVGWAGPLEAMPADQLGSLVEINLVAPLRLTRAVLPGMLARGDGHLVLVSSIAGYMGVAGEAVYAATKAGLRAFADSLRLEAADRGIGVSLIVPGAVDTNFFRRRGQPYSRRLPRMASADAVAREVLHAVQRDTAEVFVPRWLRLPARLRGAVPRAVDVLQRRLG
ncbi:SDR family NAD(P)-dependent oxidoreductase [Kutzneria viridogrisea]|uniref:Short-subunit dehydrogenase n=1 Tax=Kutzneria viridogrisea TaxID=47990 RepID=A0ABR6BUV2_9PSEU|nr:short-subunit dehydrogenase [Kutzneria viridogrisea]